MFKQILQTFYFYFYIIINIFVYSFLTYDFVIQFKDNKIINEEKINEEKINEEKINEEEINEEEINEWKINEWKIGWIQIANDKFSGMIMCATIKFIYA